MGLIHEDGQRTITVDGGLLTVSAKDTGKSAVIGLTDTSIRDGVPAGVEDVIRKRGNDPKGWYTLYQNGSPRQVLPPDSRQAVAAEIAKANGPHVAERRAVAELFNRADRLHDNPGAYFPAQARAEKAMAAWQAKYPEAAKEERKQDLMGQANEYDRKAQAAFLSDLDGSLSHEDQQRISDEHKATAAELRRKAGAL